MPIYGGDDLSKASSNVKQGEAVVILPPDLPVGTPLRISIWLDVDCVFDLSATLENGTGLTAWIMKGERDQKAIEEILQIGYELDAATRALDEGSIAEPLQMLDAAYENLNVGDFDKCRRTVQKIRIWLSGQSQPNLEIGN